MIDFPLFPTGSEQGFVEELVLFPNGELAVAFEAGARGDFRDIDVWLKTSSVRVKARHPSNTLLPLATRPHHHSISL